MDRPDVFEVVEHVQDTRDGDDRGAGPAGKLEGDRDEQVWEIMVGGFPTCGFAANLQYPHVCGKPNCRCTADPPHPHGPYHRWTRKVAGKTVTRRLSEEQARLYGPWFEEAQRLRALLSELEALSLRIAQRGANGL